MACKIEHKLEDDLIRNNIIDETSYKINNLNEFNRINDLITNHIKDKYDFNLYNEKVFRKYEIDGEYYYDRNLKIAEALNDVINHYKKEYVEEGVNRFKDPEKTLEGLIDGSADEILTVIKEPIGDNESNLESNMNIIFNNKRSENASEVLTNILDNSSLNEETKDIFNSFKNHLDAIDTKVTIVKESSMKEADNIMEYDNSTNTIRIPETTLSGNIDSIVGSFLHEVMHPLTIDAYRNPDTINKQLFKESVDKLFNKYKDSSDSYGFTNPLEFIAELISNEEFQNEVKSLENGSLYNKFINSIRRLLGFSKNNAVEELIKDIVNIARLESNSKTFTNEIFAKKDENSPYYKLRTIQDKLEYNVKEINDHLKQQLKIFNKRINQGGKVEALEKKSERLQEIIDGIDLLDETSNWQAVTNFTTELNKSLEALNSMYESFDINADNALKLHGFYRNYLHSMSIHKDIKDFVVTAKSKINELEISPDDLNAILDSLNYAENQYSTLRTQFYNYNKEFEAIEIEGDIYQTEILHKWKKKLKDIYDEDYKHLDRRERRSKEYKNKREAWVNEMINSEESPYKEEITQETKEAARDFVENPHMDIGNAARQFLTSRQINSKFVKVVKNMILKMRNTIKDKARDLDFELKPLHEKWVKAKGNNTDAYKKLLTESSADSNYKLRGKYKMEFYDTYHKIQKNYTDGPKKGEIDVKATALAKRKWIEANTVKQTNIVDGVKEIRLVPKDKWKDNWSDLDATEKEVLEKFHNIIEESHKNTFGINSLKQDFYGATYYNLPAVTKKGLEYMLKGDVTGYARETSKSFNIRPDDIGYAEKKIDMSNSPIMDIEVHYRGKLGLNEQSIDLFSIMQLEGLNGINYREKQNNEAIFNVMLDAAREKEYYRTVGGKLVKGIFNDMNKVRTIEGTESNTYKKVFGLIETNLYDIFKHKGMTFLGADMNKIMGMLGAYTGILGMGLNEVSAVTNVLNTTSQLFLESLSGKNMKSKVLAKAQSFYLKNMVGILKDSKNPIQTNIVNQILDKFDVWGDITSSQKKSFLKNTVLKNVSNIHAINFMQHSGEHWMQSVLTMAVLDDIKVMNNNSAFIDKDGNIVKDKSKAASLFDMISLDEEGKIKIDNKVFYTDHSNVEFKNGGEELIISLVKKKLEDTVGNYDKNDQPEFAKNAIAAQALIFRKYLISMGRSKWLGLQHSHKEILDLEDHQRYFSEELQEYEVGSYTTVARFLIGLGRDALYDKKFEALTRWDNMSDYEKAQFRKGVGEIILSLVVLPALTVLAAGVAKDHAEDEDDFLWFLALQAARTTTEVSSFINPAEQWRTIKSPIVSLHNIENASELIYRTLNPFSWNDRYESGYRAGELKYKRSVEKMIPIINSKSTPYKNKYEFISNQSGYY